MVASHVIWFFWFLTEMALGFFFNQNGPWVEMFCGLAGIEILGF